MQDYKLPPAPEGFGKNLPNMKLPDPSSFKPMAVREPKPFVPPEKPAPKEKEAETLGFITNMPKSVLNIAKGVFVDLPKAVASAVYTYGKNPEQYSKDIGLMLSGKSGLGETMWHELSDYYAKDFWYNFNDDPGRLLQDAASLVSGVGVAAKAGQAGRAANVMAKAAKAGHLGLMSGAAQRAAKVGRFGQKAAVVGDWLDPMTASFKLAGKGIDKGFKAAGMISPLEAIGIGELTTDLERTSRTLAAKEALASAAATRKQLFDGLTPEEAEMLREALLVGSPEQIAALKASNTPAGRRYRNWRDRIDTVEEPYVRDKEMFLTDDKMISAKAKGVEIYTSSEAWRSKNLPVISADVAEQLIRAGKLDPTFMSMYRLKNQSLDLFDAINDFGGNRGNKKISRLEKRFGKGEYITDVDEIMARQIHSFHQAKYKIDLVKAVKDMLIEKNKILLAVTPEDHDKARMLGYRKLNDEFYQKYWESYNRATAIAVAAVAKAKETGQNYAAALALAKDEFEKAEVLGQAVQRMDRAQVYVPAHVAAWLNRELAPISKGWQMYDRWMGRFKSAATVFNPRYWSSVIFGNAVLATMYGLSPDMARIAWKYRGDMPVALRQLAQHEIFLRDLNIYDRWSRTWGEAASKLDNLAKHGLFVSEIAKLTGKKFFTAQDDLERAVQFYANAPEMLVEARLAAAELRSKVAVALKQKDKAYAALKRREAQLQREIQALFDLKQISTQELSTAIAARAERLGKAFGGGDTQGLTPAEIKVKMTELLQEADGLAQAAAKAQAAGDTANYTFLMTAGKQNMDKIAAYEQVLKLTKIEPRYTYFVMAFQDELKRLVTKLKQQPELVDNAGVVAAIDSAIKFAESGRPQFLRYSLKKLKKAVRGDTPLIWRKRRLSIFVDFVGRAEERLASATADLAQKYSRLPAANKLTKSLQPAAEVADRAIDTANRFYGAYNSLLPFEKQVLRRIIPFYTFTKAMTKLAFQFPFLYPKRTFVISHLTRAWNDLMHDENAFMPSWSKNYIPVAGTDDGGVVMMRVGSFTPMANVRMGSIGEHDLPSMFDIVGQHPFIRVVFEMKGGIPEWTKRPLSPGDRAVRLDNGEVVEFSGKGFKTVIAQPPVWKAIFGMFPQSQLIHGFLSQYAQTDRGWLFNPEPIKTPAGKARYPKELMDTLLTYTIAPTTTVKEKDLQQRERVYAGLVAREFKREIRTASPERRESLINALRAWASQRRQAAER